MRNYKLIKKNDEFELYDGKSRVGFEELVSKEEKIYFFIGEMGAGKTTLIKEICKALGVREMVNSPTFAIINEYHTGTETIYHFDCYRIKNKGEAEDIGVGDYIHSGNYCFIEWPDVIEEMVDTDYVTITIKETENGRNIYVD